MTKAYDMANEAIRKYQDKYMLAGLLLTNTHGQARGFFARNFITGPAPRKLLPPDDCLEKLYENNPSGYREYVTEVSAVRWQENTGE